MFFFHLSRIHSERSLVRAFIGILQVRIIWIVNGARYCTVVTSFDLLLLELNYAFFLWFSAI